MEREIGRADKHAHDAPAIAADDADDFVPSSAPMP